MKDSKKISETTSINSSQLVFLKKQFQNFGNEDIFNDQGHIIGEIVISFLNLNKKFKIIDLNTKEFISIERKNKLFSKIYYLKKQNDEIIAYIKKNRLSLYPSKIWLKLSPRRNKFIAIGNFKKFNYTIVDFKNNKIVAKVNNIEKKQAPPKIIQNISVKYYYLKLINLKVENILMIAFTICINLLNNPHFGASDLAGPERKFARLRPFGPGRNLN
jgi:uncharacterized protein YxjI